MELVGRHIVEFVGIQRFEERVKPNLDSCFAGELVDYTYSKDVGNSDDRRAVPDDALRDRAPARSSAQS